METGMQHTTAKHNPLTFYLRMLLYMFVALLLRLLALAPLACLFVFPAGSPLKLLALLCPVLLVLLVLPLRYSFAEAMVRRDGRRYFSFDTALNLGNYGEKLAESLLHAAHVIKWGIPFFAMLIYGYYWYKEVDALTLLSTLTQLGRGWTNTWCSVANFFLGLVGGAQLTPPQNTLMDGVAAVLAVLGLGVAVWLYGAVRNSAARYVWAYANRNDHSPRKELRRRLRGRRLAQLGVSLINLVLWIPFAIVAVTAVKGAVSGAAEALMAAITQQGSAGLDMAAAVVPLLAAFVCLYMPLLPIRRILTAAFALWDHHPKARSGASLQQTASVPAGEAAPAFTPGENGTRP